MQMGGGEALEISLIVPFFLLQCYEYFHYEFTETRLLGPFRLTTDRHITNKQTDRQAKYIYIDKLFKIKNPQNFVVRCHSYHF